MIVLLTTNLYCGCAGVEEGLEASEGEDSFTRALRMVFMIVVFQDCVEE